MIDKHVVRRMWAFGIGRSGAELSRSAMEHRGLSTPECLRTEGKVFVLGIDVNS